MDVAVVGVDIGTTATKSVVFDQAGRVRATRQVGYPLHEPVAGYAEQDPEQIVAAVLDTIRHAAADSRCHIAALSFSGAMHSLIGLDAKDAPLTPSVTWADLRAVAQAQRLRSADFATALHQRTGTPVHPMSPLPKLMWFRETQPELFAKVRHWVGIKDYTLLRL
jgi:gluconokinase